ncbi:hypothetical protein CWI38_1240p0020, partial [Hamiltosporidium tvaerminnensis]
KNLQNLHEIQPSIAENKNDILNKYFNWYKKNVNEDTQYNDILYVLHDPTQNEALMNHNIDINTIVDQNGNPIPDAKSKREILVNFLLYYKSFVNPNGQDRHPHAKKRHDISKKTYAISDINKNFKEDVNQNIQKPINYSDLDSAETHSNEKYDKFVQIFQNQENTETLNSLNNNDFNENHDIFPPQYFSNTYPGATEDKIDFYPNTTESNMTKSKYPDNKSYMPGVHSNIYRFSNTDDKIDDSGIPYVFDRNNLEVNVMFREEGADSHSNIGAEYKNPNVSYTNYFNILSGLDSNTTKNTKNTDKAIKNFNIAHQKTHLCTLHMSESEYFTYGNLNYGVIKEQGENNDARILGNIESGNILNKNSYYNSLYDDINSNTTKDNESTNLSNSAIFPVQNPSTDSRNFLQQKMNLNTFKGNGRYDENNISKATDYMPRDSESNNVQRKTNIFLIFLKQIHIKEKITNNNTCYLSIRLLNSMLYEWLKKGNIRPAHEAVFCNIQDRSELWGAEGMHQHSNNSINFENEYAEIRVNTIIKTHVNIRNNRPYIFILNKIKIENHTFKKYDPCLVDELGIDLKFCDNLSCDQMEWYCRCLHSADNDQKSKPRSDLKTEKCWNRVYICVIKQPKYGVKRVRTNNIGPFIEAAGTEDKDKRNGDYKLNFRC